MTEKELEKYLAENLKIEFFPFESCEDYYLGVRILLNGKEISSSDSFVKFY